MRGAQVEQRREEVRVKVEEQERTGDRWCSCGTIKANQNESQHDG